MPECICVFHSFFFFFLLAVVVCLCVCVCWLLFCLFICVVLRVAATAGFEPTAMPSMCRCVLFMANCIIMTYTYIYIPRVHPICPRANALHCHKGNATTRLVEHLRFVILETHARLCHKYKSIKKKKQYFNKICKERTTKKN